MSLFDAEKILREVKLKRLDFDFWFREKKQLEESKIERQHKEECEAIRKFIALQMPRSEM